MDVIIDNGYRWHHATEGDLRYWFIGNKRAVKIFVSFLQDNLNASNGELKNKLCNLRGHFAFIVQQGERIIAGVDKIRSYPVFYVHDGNKFAVSNSARTLKDKCSISEIDELSILEFRMAGYVTGRETLYRDLYQLQAGELLVWDETNRVLERERYYLFYSEEVREGKEDVLIEEVDAVTNKIFHRIIEEANGAPIWVPLSGGLDSRLVLCKLKQLGYDNLTALSYGAVGNYESKAAKHVAERVSVPWRFVPVSMKESKVFFYSDVRKKYWAFSDGLSCVPNMQDIHALIKLRREKSLPRDVIIINGQSGDFITGGHIPVSFHKQEPYITLLLSWALEKHYSQWLNLKTEQNLNRITNKILNLIGLKKNVHLDVQKLASLYEQWEWQERQCKYVINGQRIYDFFGIKWFLPLWDDDYLRFWEKVAFEQKYSQRLYKAYLDHFDFYGLFKAYNPKIWRWPGITITVVPFARIIKLLFGKKYSDLFYGYFKYIGHYRQFYSPYSIRNHLRKAPKIRGPMSLNIETWIKENLGEISLNK